MNDLVISQIFQPLQNLDGKPPNQAQRHALEVIILNKFVQIHAQNFERNYQMLSEENIVFCSNNVIYVIKIVLVEVL